MPRKTKIIATLGPASSGLDTIRDMVGAGMDAARLNFSHGDYTSHSQFVDRVRAAAAGHDRAVAIIQDIQGPRIRAGTFPDGSVELQTGDEMDLVVDRGEPAASGEIPILMLDTAIVVKPGDRVLLDDGLIRLEVIGVDGAKARARVVEGGALHDHKGAVLPDSDLELPPVTDKDRRDLEFGAEAGVDLVAASFVASGDDVRLVKKLAGDIPIIAKIERRIAYEALDDILEVAAGAMVARGDLGVELSIQKLPVVQKDIIRKTNASGHISITATEMLESMVHSPRPTRAEVADVANALIDGTDAIMLSAETAIGRDPVRVLEVLDIVCREIEQSESSRPDLGVAFLEKELPFPSAVAKAAVQASDNLGLPAIVAFTESGATARLLSKYRPSAPIVTFTAIDKTYSQMALYWGVIPLRFPRLNSTDAMIAGAEQALLNRGIVESGASVAMVAGIPPNQQSATNLLKLHHLGDLAAGVPGSV